MTVARLMGRAQAPRSFGSWGWRWVVQVGQNAAWNRHPGRTRHERQRLVLPTLQRPPRGRNSAQPCAPRKFINPQGPLDQCQGGATETNELPRAVAYDSGVRTPPQLAPWLHEYN